jgi:hypothetical protein
MGSLAETYYYLKKYDDALALEEEVLLMYRRVLPEDHPDVGEGHMWSAACVLFC